MSLRSLTFVFFSFWVAACASPEVELEEFLLEDRYAEARAILEEEEVGHQVSPSAEPEALAMRVRFSQEIEASTTDLVEGLLSEGSLFEAQAIARERQALCPWSMILTRQVELCDYNVAIVFAAEETWTPIFRSGSIDAEIARKFLSEISPSRPWILDSPRLKDFESSVVDLLVSEWASWIKQSSGRLGESDRRGMFVELMELGFSLEELDGLRIPLTVLANYSANERIDSVGLEALAKARHHLESNEGGASKTKLAPCNDAAWTAFSHWYRTDFADGLVAADVTYEEVKAAEAWDSIKGYGTTQRVPLARAHAHLASRRSPQGVAATLALLHIKRAIDLGLNPNDSELVEAQNVGKATRAATPLPSTHLLIKVDPQVNPELQEIVASTFRFGMRGEVDALSTLDFLPLSAVSTQVVLTVVDAVFVSDFSKVREVSSTYFSHYETVANPVKAMREIGVDSARWTMDSKERSYNSAVSSHNIYRTQYSLNNANWAYSAYSLSVNHYNSLVAQYNATPSTIRNSVYLPYSFQEGNVRFGWDIKAKVEIPGLNSEFLTSKSIVQDFIRIGSKATDRKENYRRQDGLDIDTSGEAGFGHLLSAIVEIKTKINPSLGHTTLEPLASLSSEEQAILGWLYHPWGIQESLSTQLGVPAWASHAAQGLSLERPVTEPPIMELKPSSIALNGPFDTESASDALAHFVCQIRSLDAGNAIASGTGALIGENGLILTCAHVLVGSGLQIEIAQGEWKGIYEGELVFVNSERDVALVRAKNLKNSDWAEVRLDAPSHQGEAIVAIGNPAMDFGGTNLGGMSVGIVSNPRITQRGSVYLSADISIASGSSGGPLFSLKDGSLIGIVQMVATSPGLPQVEGQVASTGFLCLAAPGTSLSEWLGLR